MNENCCQKINIKCCSKSNQICCSKMVQNNLNLIAIFSNNWCPFLKKIGNEFWKSWLPARKYEIQAARKSIENPMKNDGRKNVVQKWSKKKSKKENDLMKKWRWPEQKVGGPRFKILAAIAQNNGGQLPQLGARPMSKAWAPQIDPNGDHYQYQAAPKLNAVGCYGDQNGGCKKKRTPHFLETVSK